MQSRPIGKVQAIDGSYVPRAVRAPCGFPAYFDNASGCAYICSSCFAVLGSIGMPKECSDLYEEDK